MKIKLNHQDIELTPNRKLDFILDQHPNSEWWKDIIDFLEQWASDSKTIQVKTSGSTGEPKIWNVEKYKFWISATKTCEYFRLNKNSVGLLCLSTKYIAGKMMLVRAMVSGMNLICIPPSENPVEELNSNIDFAAMVPMQVRSALSIPNQFNNIQNIIIGGGQVDTKLQKMLSQYTGNAYETFGMTETLSHIALRPVAPIPSETFKTLSGISISQGFNNCLVIDYPELGIYKMKTNDIVELENNSGNFIWKGRSDFVINSGGIKISPEEIEKKISHLIDQRFCIVGIHDEKLNEKVVLVIEGEKFDTTILVENLKKSLSSYACPKEILFAKQFPKTENGKIKRKELNNILT